MSKNGYVLVVVAMLLATSGSCKNTAEQEQKKANTLLAVRPPILARCAIPDDTTSTFISTENTDFQVFVGTRGHAKLVGSSSGSGNEKRSFELLASSHTKGDHVFVTDRNGAEDPTTGFQDDDQLDHVINSNQHQPSAPKVYSKTGAGWIEFKTSCVETGMNTESDVVIKPMGNTCTTPKCPK